MGFQGLIRILGYCPRFFMLIEQLVKALHVLHNLFGCLLLFKTCRCVQMGLQVYIA